MTEALIPHATVTSLSGPVKPTELLVRDMERLLQVGLIYLKSGFLPPSIRTPEAVVVVLQMARALGLDEAMAFKNIHVIEGRPSLSVQLMLGLVEREHGRGLVRVVESTDQQAVVDVAHPSGRPTRYTWTLQDAQRAGVTGKDVWKRYPKQMLRWRCLGDALRTEFPATLLGIYTPEELNAPVDLDAAGNMIVLEPRRAAEGTLTFQTRDDAPEDAPDDAPDDDWNPVEHTAWGAPRAAGERASADQLHAIRRHLQRTGQTEAGVTMRAGLDRLEDLTPPGASALLGTLSRIPNAARPDGAQ